MEDLNEAKLSAWLALPKDTRLSQKMFQKVVVAMMNSDKNSAIDGLCSVADGDGAYRSIADSEVVPTVSICWLEEGRRRAKVAAGLR